LHAPKCDDHRSKNEKAAKGQACYQPANTLLDRETWGLDKREQLAFP
jgi:hypothetical protein